MARSSRTGSPARGRPNISTSSTSSGTRWSRRSGREHGKFAADHGVKIAIEMHPGFVVYSPETMLRCAPIAGPSVGCNFDPSHLFWQGIDPIAAIRVLGDCIFHVHAKDTQIYERQPADDRRARHQELHRRSPTAAGSSAPSATATPASGGPNSSPPCGCSATTTSSPSSTRIR